MKQSRITALLLAAVLLLSLFAGCAEDSVTSTTAARISENSSQSDSASEPVTAEPTTAAPETAAQETAAPETVEVPVRYRLGADYGPAHNGEKISMLRLAEMPYVHQDAEQLIADYDALIERAKTSLDTDALLAAYFDLEYRQMQFDSMYTLAAFRNDLNTTDSYYEAEYNYCVAQSNLLSDKYAALMQAFAASPCRSILEREYDGFYFDYYANYNPDGGAEYLELQQQESKLLEQYHALISAPSVTYAGETKLLNEWKKSDSVEIRDAAYSAYIEQYHDEIGALYLEIVRVRQQLAAASGYENYIDFIYDSFGRDYTPEEAELFLSDVRHNLVPVANALYERDPNFHLGYSDTLNEDPIALLSTAAEQMGGPIWDACRFLSAYELYDLSPTPEKRDRSFVTYLTEYEAPIIFINPLKYRDVYGSISHEFGHFVDCFVHYGMYDDTETTETFSQAMVYLALANAALPEEEKAEALRMSLAELLLERIIERCTYADFELWVYSEDPEALTLEKLDEIYEQCCLNDGHRVPYADAIRPMSWVRDLYFFDNPGYVISYPISAVASLQICQKEAGKPGAGVAAFYRLLGCADGRYFFQDAVTIAGLKNPLRQKYKNSPLADIAAFLKKALELP